MPRQVYIYDSPERFVAGTVGEPGHRSFYLQASARGRITSVLLEKGQVVALAERVEELLDEVVRRTGGSTSVPALAPPELMDLAPLDSPVQEEFRVGSMALAWDNSAQLLVVEAQEILDGGDGSPVLEHDQERLSLLRVRLTGSMARVFTKRALSLVSAGRVPCPFCSLPLDPEGHVCPRQNGYRR